jgi:hypothetical protein
MVEDMILAGLAESTKKSYLRQVEGLARHYMIAPDKLTERQVREYFLYLRETKKVSRGAFQQALGGIRFLYDITLDHNWSLFSKKDRRATSKTFAGCSVGRRSPNVAGGNSRSGLSCMYVHDVRLWTTHQ